MPSIYDGHKQIMSNVKLKNLPVLTLADVLRRRKLSLKQFIHDSGVQSYAGLMSWCTNFGVQPPSKKEYDAICPKTKTSQIDGIVVLDAPLVIDERSGKEINLGTPTVTPEKVVTKNENQQKLSKKKKTTTKRTARRGGNNKDK